MTITWYGCVSLRQADQYQSVGSFACPIPSDKEIEHSLFYDIIGDVVDLYEVNRKEGAKLVLTALRDSFNVDLLFPALAEDNKKKESGSEIAEEGTKWRLEACVIEVIQLNTCGILTLSRQYFLGCLCYHRL